MFKKKINEIRLLQSCVNGENKAFGAIVEKYKSYICAITFSATGDVKKSEELAQETFINAWKNLAQLNDFSKFQSWLASIARNVVKNFIRTQKRDVLQNAVPLDEVGEEGIQVGGLSEDSTTQEQLAVVGRALAGIPEMYREPLVLFYRQQQSIKQD